MLGTSVARTLYRHVCGDCYFYSWSCVAPKEPYSRCSSCHTRAWLDVACGACADLTVTDGSSFCQIDTNGCATDGSGEHGNNERCTIRVNTAGRLAATQFDTEARYDYITIGETRYEGRTGPTGVVVSAGSTFVWQSDHSVTNDGWTICLTPGVGSTAPTTVAPSLSPTGMRPPIQTAC